MARRTPSSQAGFSMVELMVALVLGVILTSGVISVYISSKATYNTSTSLGQVEDTGRYALGFMQPILSLAGNTGCSRFTNSTTPYTTFVYLQNDVNSIYAGSAVSGTSVYTPVYNFGLPVFGYEANNTGINAAIPSNGGQTASSPPSPDTSAADWTPALSWNDGQSVLTTALNVSGVGGVLQYNDVLMVHEAQAQPAAVVSATPYFDTSSVYVNPSGTANAAYTASNFTAGQFAIATDCSNNGYAFEVTNVNTSSGALGYTGTTPAPGNSTTGGISSTTGAYSVQPANTYVFYVGEGQDKWPALWEGTFSGSGTALSTQELVSGVENMQVLYGVDTGGDQIPDYFTTADQVQSGGNGANSGGLWNQVVAVRVALVVQSDNYAVDSASSAATTVYMLGSGSGYTDNTSLTTPKDQRLRRVFVQTFSLRSVLP